MPDSEKVYQIKKLEGALNDLKAGQESQGRILKDISTALSDISSVMRKFSEISSEQVEQRIHNKNLQKDSDRFNDFLENRQCEANTTKITTLAASDDSQNKNTSTFIIGFLIALATGFLTWLTTKG